MTPKRFHSHNDHRYENYNVQRYFLKGVLRLSHVDEQQRIRFLYYDDVMIYHTPSYCKPKSPLFKKIHKGMDASNRLLFSPKGKKGVMEFHNNKGVARLVPGQYRGVWKIDKHQGKYDALCQRNGNVTVWRDANRDLLFEEKVTDTGMFGINIHKAGTDSTWVENWSEGCQVFKKVKDFDAFMSICRKASAIHGNKFSYTLLESTDII